MKMKFQRHPYAALLSEQGLIIGALVLSTSAYGVELHRTKLPEIVTTVIEPSHEGDVLTGGGSRAHVLQPANTIWFVTERGKVPATLYPQDDEEILDPTASTEINNLLVYFDFDHVNPISWDRLKSLAIRAKQLGSQIDIVAHADEVGSDAYNIKLSKRRAKVVADYFVTQGVPLANIKYEGHGKREPIDKHDPSKNRRAFINLS